MALKDDLARAEKVIEEQQETIDKLKEELGDYKEEVQHYRMAISGVKWLWEQAAQQRPFQL